MKQSRTGAPLPGVESPRHLPLVDLLVDARIELFELAVRSVMLTKGIPLPMISYGGSSLLSTLALLGILMNVSEHAG